MVNRSWKEYAGTLLDPTSEWQARRVAAMKAGKAQLETLGGAYTAYMKDVYSTWDIMHAFSSEPTLQETAARLLIVISDTRTLAFTDVEVVIRGHALTFVECRILLYNSLVTALVRHGFLQTPWGSGCGGCMNDVKACTALQITQAIRKMNQSAPDRYPNPAPWASGQEILYAKNSHTRLLSLLHDILLAQYQTSVPSQTRTPHRLMMWSCASLLLNIIKAPSRQGLEGAFNRRTFSSLPLRGTDELGTAEQHNGLAAFLPAHPRLDTDLREKHERWAVILSDWIQGGSIIDTVVDRVNPTLRLDLALLGLELLLWFDEGSEEESAVLNGLHISHGHWANFSTILGESVKVREAIMALLTSASDPRRQES